MLSTEVETSISSRNSAIFLGAINVSRYTTKREKSTTRQKS